MHRRRSFTVALVAAALACAPTLAVAAQGSATAPAVAALSRSHEASLLAVPKFVLHAGLAFGAFHHFIYVPFKAGKFTSGSFLSKLKNYVEAGAAALFIYHEAKLALADAQQNKVLKLLVSPLSAAVALFATIASRVKGHNLDAAQMTSAQSAVTMIESRARTSGSSITEGVPTASQILAGSVS